MSIGFKSDVSPHRTLPPWFCIMKGNAVSDSWSKRIVNEKKASSIVNISANMAESRFNFVFLKCVRGVIYAKNGGLVRGFVRGSHGVPYKPFFAIKRRSYILGKYSANNGSVECSVCDAGKLNICNSPSPSINLIYVHHYALCCIRSHVASVCTNIHMFVQTYIRMRIHL